MFLIYKVKILGLLKMLRLLGLLSHKIFEVFENEIIFLKFTKQNSTHLF